MSKFKKVAEALEKLSVPQRAVQGKIKEALGITGKEDEASADIVQNLAERLNLPENSTAVNVGKAIASIPVELATDPLSFIPGAKQIKMGAKAIKSGAAYKVTEETAQKLGKLYKALINNPESASKLKPETLKQLENLQKASVSVVDNTPKVKPGAPSKVLTENTSRFETLSPDAGYGATVGMKVKDPGKVVNMQPSSTQVPGVTVIQEGKAPQRLEGATTMGTQDTLSAEQYKAINKIQKKKQGQ